MVHLPSPPTRKRDGSRRAVILAVASDQFGRQGFDATKWSDIAAGAGIGGTALYHYFESKNHCLFTLLADSLIEWAGTYERLLTPGAPARPALLAVVQATFAISEHDAVQNRLLVEEQGKLSTIHGEGPEEEARQEALAAARRVEQVWVAFLLRGMQSGDIPVADSRLLARAVIGLLQSVWRWYRPTGAYRLEDLNAFFSEAVLRLTNVAPAGPAG
jgi:AcrR family transcriptional regulator